MKKEEILANCIEDIRNGKTTFAACVARYPQLVGELNSLLEITAALKPDDVTPSPEFVNRARRRLFIEMEASSTKKSRNPSRIHSLAPVRWIAGVLIGLFGFAGIGGGTVYAAQSSLPGDALYSVKTTTENIQLALTWDTEDKADLHVKLAERRIEEATRQVQQNREIDVQALATAEQHFNYAIQDLNKSGDTAASDKVLSNLSTTTLNQQIELEQALANAPESSKPALAEALTVTRRSNLVAAVAYANPEFLQGIPSVTDKALDAGQFKINGTLSSIQGNTWNVGGVTLENVHSPAGIPAIGSQVIIEGLVNGGQVFVSRIDLIEGTQTVTSIEGQYGGINENGTVNVAGVPVEISANFTVQPQPGEDVHLQGDQSQGKLDMSPIGNSSQGSNTPIISNPVTNTPVISNPVTNTPVTSKPVTSTPDNSSQVTNTPDNTSQATNTPDNTSQATNTPDNTSDQGSQGNTNNNEENNKNINPVTTKLSGVLKAVNLKSGTVVVESAGSKFTVNVSKAQIVNDNGKKLSLSALVSLVGQNVKLDGLYKKGKVLFASQMQVESHTYLNHGSSSGQGQSTPFHTSPSTQPPTSSQNGTRGPQRSSSK